MREEEFQFMIFLHLKHFCALVFTLLLKAVFFHLFIQGIVNIVTA